MSTTRWTACLASKNQRFLNIYLLRCAVTAARHDKAEVLKISVIVKKCTGSDRAAVQKMEWVLSLMCDLYNNNGLSFSDFTKAGMEGVGAAPTKGSVDVVLLKQEILQYLLRFCREEIRCTDVCEKLTEITATVSDFRSSVGRCWKSDTVPMPWRASWRQSSDMLLSMVERVVFYSAMDEIILTHLRSRKALKDFFETGPMADELEEIREQLKVEAGKADEEAQTDAVVARGDEDDDDEEKLPFSLDALDILQDKPAAMDEADKIKLDRYKAQARALVAAHVFLMEETAEGTEIQQGMQAAMQGATEQLQDGAYILIYYGQSESGECSAQPHLRVPPLRNRGEHLRTFVQNCMMRHGKACEIDRNDVYVINDCGREGNRGLLLSAFQVPPEAGAKKGTAITAKVVRNMFLIVSEESMSERMGKIRGHSVNQVQGLTVVTRTTPSLAIHPRLYTEGSSNRGNVIGPLAMESHSSEHW